MRTLTDHAGEELTEENLDPLMESYTRMKELHETI